MDRILVELICLFIGKAFMNDLTNRCTHLYWMIGLEDISSHVKTFCSALNGSVSQCQSFILRKLLSSCNHDRNRAGSYNFFKVIAVIGFYNIGAQFSHHTGSQLKETICTLHLLAYCNNAHHRD